ncbi:MAG: hypothetical protein JO042_07510, partial [Sinobacteraceae bacterium]|nr:hypothetical protein [Nevskiaceae bacterium]
MMPVIPRAYFAMLIAGFVCVGLLGCGKSGPPERVVNIYNWADYIGQDTIAQFER